MLKLNVTECHLCHRCPRLLAYQTRGSRKAWKVGLEGSGQFPGKLFHDLVAKSFHQHMCKGPSSNTYRAAQRLLAKPPEQLREGLLALMDRYILEPMLKKEASSLKSDQITALAGGMYHWVDNLTGFLNQSRERRQKVVLSDLFCLPEKKLTAEIKVTGGQTIQLTGQFDSLLIDQQSNEAVIIEFKGLKPSHTDEDLIQVALYALLLKKATGIKPRGTVLYLEEKDQVADFSAQTLASMSANLEQLIQTAVETKSRSSQKGRTRLGLPNDQSLCTICPFDPKCDQDWGLRIDISSKKSKTKTKENEADVLMQKLIETLNAIKLPVEPDGYILGPRLVRLKIKPQLAKGTTVSKIERRANDLQIALSTKVPPLIQTAAGHMTIDIPRKVTTPLTLGEVWDLGQSNRPQARAAFPMGMAVDGSIFWAKLSDATMTSMLVAGTAGSGKSVFLRSAILGMARNASPEHIRLTLIDPKLVSFTDFSGLPHLDGSIIFEIKPAMQVLKRLVDEMEQRYQMFSNSAVFDIGEYTTKIGDMPHHVVVIDEYADLMVEKDLKKDAELLIQRLCQKGRAAGFHIILSTQRPDAKVVTPIIKANLQLKIALKVTTTSNSNVVLDTRGAENLMGNGDMLVGGAVQLVRLQGPIATKTDLERVLADSK